MLHGKRTAKPPSVYGCGCILNLSVSDLGPLFVTTMCDKFLREEFVEIRVSFNGERFHKSCVIESYVRPQLQYNRFILKFLNLLVFPLG